MDQSANLGSTLQQAALKSIIKKQVKFHLGNEPQVDGQNHTSNFTPMVARVQETQILMEARNWKEQQVQHDESLGYAQNKQSLFGQDFSASINSNNTAELEFESSESPNDHQTLQMSSQLQERMQQLENTRERAGMPKEIYHISQVKPDYNYEVGDFINYIPQDDETDFGHQHQLVQAIYKYKNCTFVPIVGQPQFDKASRFYLPETFNHIQHDEPWRQQKLIFHDFDIEDVEQGYKTFSFRKDWYLSLQFEKDYAQALIDKEKDIQNKMEMLARLAILLAHPNCSHFTPGKSSGTLTPFLKIENARCILDKNLVELMHREQDLIELRHTYSTDRNQPKLSSFSDEYQFSQREYKLKSNQIFCGKFEMKSTKYNNFIWCLNAGLGIQSEQQLLNGGIMHLSALIFRVLFSKPINFDTEKQAKNMVALCIQNNNFDLRFFHNVPVSFYGISSQQEFLNGVSLPVLDRLAGAIYYKHLFEQEIDDTQATSDLQYDNMANFMKHINWLDKPAIMQIVNETTVTTPEGQTKPEHYIQTVLVYFVDKDTAEAATRDSGLRKLHQKIVNSKQNYICFVQDPLTKSHSRSSKKMVPPQQGFEYNDVDFAEQQTDEFLLSIHFLTEKYHINPTKDQYENWFSQIAQGSKFGETKNQPVYKNAKFKSLNFFIPVRRPYENLSTAQQDGLVQYAYSVASQHESIRHINWNLLPNALNQFKQIVYKIRVPDTSIVQLAEPNYQENIGKDFVTMQQLIDLNNRCVPQNAELSFQNQTGLNEVRDSEINVLPIVVQNQIRQLRHIFDKVKRDQVSQLESDVLPFTRFQVELQNRLPEETLVQQFTRSAFMIYVAGKPSYIKISTLDKLYKLLIYKQKTPLHAMLNQTPMNDFKLDIQNFEFPALPQLLFSVSQFNYTHGTDKDINMKKIVDHRVYLYYNRDMMICLFYCLRQNYCDGMSMDDLCQIVQFAPQVLYNFSTLLGLKLYCNSNASKSVEKYLLMIQQNLPDYSSIEGKPFDKFLEFMLLESSLYIREDDNEVYTNFLLGKRHLFRKFILNDEPHANAIRCYSDLQTKHRSNNSVHTPISSDASLDSIVVLTKLDKLKQRAEKLDGDIKSEDGKRNLVEMIDQASQSVKRVPHSEEKLRATITKLELEYNTYSNRRRKDIQVQPSKKRLKKEKDRKMNLMYSLEEEKDEMLEFKQ